MINKMKSIIFLLVTFLMTLTDPCSSNATDLELDPKELLYQELSPETYFNLPFHEPGDTAVSMRRQYLDRGHFNEWDWLSTEDYQYQKRNDQPALKWGPGGAVVDTDFYNTDQASKTENTLNPDAWKIFHLCYAISYMWRRGRKGIHRYYSRRQTYYDHMPFEIGYITQTIMSKYQNVLELYEYSTRLAAEENRKIGRPHLYFFYKNILEDCRTIIHLCNMIHEVTRKYKVLAYSYPNATWIPVVYDPAQKFQDPVGIAYRDRFPYDQRPLREVGRGIEGLEHQKVHHEDPKIFARIKQAVHALDRQNERIAEIAKEKRNYFLDHHHFAMSSPTTRRTKRWSSGGPLVYGWGSGED